MKYRCIRARMGVEAGDEVEVPDGATVSPMYYEPADATPAAPTPSAAGAGDGKQAPAGPSAALSAPSGVTPKAGA